MDGGRERAISQRVFPRARTDVGRKWESGRKSACLCLVWFGMVWCAVLCYAMPCMDVGKGEWKGIVFFFSFGLVDFSIVWVRNEEDGYRFEFEFQFEL